MPNTNTVILERLRGLLQSESEQNRLVEAALLIGMSRNPDLDINAYLRQIGDWSDYILGQFDPASSDAVERITHLNRFLFDEMGFAGNAEDYSDPRNSFLDAVIDRRLGIPITLSILYIELGRRIGLPLQGVSFPGHFLVMLPVSQGAVVLDPFSEGASLELNDLEQLLRQAQPQGHWEPSHIKSLLVPASPADILIRLLRNLKAIYWQKKELLDAIWVQDQLLAISPELAEERRDRGILHQDIGYFSAAIQDFKIYLEQAPNAIDAELIRARIIDLNKNTARLH